jgi:hypothetical protein
MKRFTNSIRTALQARDWYGALTTALTLPDICGRMETPNEGSNHRYARWFSKWVEPLYMMESFGEKHVFLSGNDCYALRCSLLHEGGENIEEQRAKEALENFHFIEPPANGNSIHKIQSNQSLLLQVDIFCNDIADAVDRWVASDTANTPEITDRMEGLLLIRDVSGGLQF